jgi:hypothetical protein
VMALSECRASEDRQQQGKSKNLFHATNLSTVANRVLAHI